jgi:hypothetical protein
MRLPNQPEGPVYIQPYWVGREPVFETPEEMYKHCVGPGWQELLLKLTEKLFHLGWGGGLLQVKEKFGTLRFYFVNDCPGLNSDIAFDVVAMAEDRSGQICEECGANGRSYGDGWVKTFCIKHAIAEKRPLKTWERKYAVEKGFLSAEDGETYPIWEASDV